MAREVTFTGERDGIGSLADPSSSALWPKLMTQLHSRFQAWREEGIVGVMKRA